MFSSPQRRGKAPLLVREYLDSSAQRKGRINPWGIVLCLAWAPPFCSEPGKRWWLRINRSRPGPGMNFPSVSPSGYSFATGWILHGGLAVQGSGAGLKVPWMAIHCRSPPPPFGSARVMRINNDNSTVSAWLLRNVTVEEITTSC